MVEQQPERSFLGILCGSKRCLTGVLLLGGLVASLVFKGPASEPTACIWDFGVISNEYPIETTVMATTTIPLTDVETVSTSCGCLSATIPPGTLMRIGRGQALRLRLSYEPRDLLGEQERYLRVRLKGGGVMTYAVRGTIIPAFAVRPRRRVGDAEFFAGHTTTRFRLALPERDATISCNEPGVKVTWGEPQFQRGAWWREADVSLITPGDTMTIRFDCKSRLGSQATEAVLTRAETWARLSPTVWVVPRSSAGQNESMTAFCPNVTDWHTEPPEFEDMVAVKINNETIEIELHRQGQRIPTGLVFTGVGFSETLQMRTQE